MQRWFPQSDIGIIGLVVIRTTAGNNQNDMGRSIKNIFEGITDVGGYALYRVTEGLQKDGQQ
eukprot:scaffold482_cov266-Amphora_coffeaeformis.AAC.13